MDNFIETVNRLNDDLLHILILQFPKTNENYFKVLKCWYEVLKHCTYGPSIRNHFTLKSVDEFKHIKYTLNGQYHREYDQPAYIGANGSKYWYQHGKHHRDGDLPAVIRRDGSKEWWKNGKLIKII